LVAVLALNRRRRLGPAEVAELVLTHVVGFGHVYRGRHRHFFKTLVALDSRKSVELF
jgi:hypothetical protein